MEDLAVRLFIGLVLSALMGGLGYWRRSLSISGVVGAMVVGTLIFGLGGWIWGLILITFFFSSSFLSHYRQREKEAVAEKFAKGVRRDLGQALANGGLGAILAIAFATNPDPVLLAAYLGAMATVNADTWATEMGILSLVPPRLVTTGDPVPPGTSGAVSRLGIWAALAGSLLIGAVATALTQASSLLGGRGWDARAISFPILAVAGGMAGSLFDSLLGATMQGIYYCERCRKETESPVHRCGHPARPVRGWLWLNNDLVNFISSIVGGVVAAALALLFWR
ncbi:MAG TPA: DUF92 domain-containing protein [Anaerolineae bacterium]|nr:DUF92 domain-containing protein [Anaerolineae bacterium]